MGWFTRVGGLFTAALIGLLVPAVAWASEGPGVLAVAGELARPRPARRGFGFLGTLCCLVVVGGIVVALVLLMRRRRR